MPFSSGWFVRDITLWTKGNDGQLGFSCLAKFCAGFHRQSSIDASWVFFTSIKSSVCTIVYVPLSAAHTKRQEPWYCFRWLLKKKKIFYINIFCRIKKQINKE